MKALLRYLPRNHLSAVTGWLTHIKLPKQFALPLLQWFSNRYRINEGEAELPLDQYGSIGEFFTRNLKPGIRPIDGRLVSPIDGTLRSASVITDGWLEQIKGKRYSLKALLGSEELAAFYSGGFAFNYYLSPQDYHHVHAPASGKILEMTAIPGTLWPVNDWALENVPDLFSVNERIHFTIESVFGKICVVMVGALNVGKISLTFDPYTTNDSTDRSLFHRVYDSPRSIEVGARVGTFHMGSSVILLCPPSLASELSKIPFQPHTKVRFGQAILS